jgi:hypothetical protein
MPKAKLKGYEPFEMSFAGALTVFVFLVIGAVIIHAVLWDWLKGMPGRTKVDAALRWNPASETALQKSRLAQLQLTPQSDWEKVRTSQETSLHRYGWVDKEHGVARVPIEITMQRLLDDGLPRWTTNSSVSPLELQRQRARINTKGSQ